MQVPESATTPAIDDEMIPDLPPAFLDVDALKGLIYCVRATTAFLDPYTPRLIERADMPIADQADSVDSVILGARDNAIIAGFAFQRRAFVAMAKWVDITFGTDS